MSNVLIACEQFGVIRDAFIARGHNAVSCDLMPTRVPGPHYEGDVRDILSPWYWDLIIAHPDCTYLTVSAALALCDPDYDRYPGIGYHQKISAGTLVGAERRKAQKEALDFVELLASVKCHRIAIENPATGAINKNVNLTKYGFRSNFPTQVIQPHQFGHDASKSTGLALKGLPDLVPTCYVEPRLVCKVCKGTFIYGLHKCPSCYSHQYTPRWSNQTDSGQNTLSPGDDRAMQRAKTYQGWADAMADQWGVLL